MSPKTIDEAIEQCRKVGVDRINEVLSDLRKLADNMRPKISAADAPVIYVLYSYDEGGAGDDLFATTDPEQLRAKLEEMTRPEYFAEERDRLLAAVKAGTPGRHDLSLGWGGRVLHIC